MSTWEKVKRINSSCNNTDIRLCYSWREKAYFLCDTKYNYRIYTFSINEIEAKSEKEILSIKDKYIKSNQKLSAVEKFKESLSKEVGKYWFYLKELRWERIVLNTVNWSIILNLDEKNLNSIKNLRLYTLSLISKLT